MQDQCSSPKLTTLHLQSNREQQRTAAASMRKYQQLALTIITIISLVSFLFYKHEYERLRYVLEYLDTFGEPPSDLGAVRPQCGYSTQSKVSTPPADWVQVSPEFYIYSAFWDDNGKGQAQVRAIGVLRTGVEPKEVNCKLWYERENQPRSGKCTMKKENDRNHGLMPEEKSSIEIWSVFCSQEGKVQSGVVPYMIQFEQTNGELSSAVYVYESESWKSVVNRTAICVIPLDAPTETLRIVEFISYHNLVGVEKFTIYGSVLTPAARKLLDRYGDEVGIHFEEKQFNTPMQIQKTSLTARRVIELDCMYRHKDTHENVLILALNEFILPNYHGNTIQDLLADFVLGRSKSISEFHLSSQKICIDADHSAGHASLWLGMRTHIVEQPREVGVALLRPHLVAVPVGHLNPADEQHVPPSAARIYNYVSCNTPSHPEENHLPIIAKYVDLIEKSLLYRKWKIIY
ncbi:uncharacterized protein LOC143026547 [Oratosquilla oratoria]|uniref:uncharacterized protein LOC143026547 n=1 Tax=Oratosquilla oratoria TaxID=337810 RepID=UPI003F777A81